MQGAFKQVTGNEKEMKINHLLEITMKWAREKRNAL